MKRSKKKPSDESRRVRFPEEESELPWLSMLLDAYAVIDEGVSTAVRNEERKRKTKLACGEGCGNCCRTHGDIPLYPLELVGIYWFATEKMAQSLRSILKNQLSGNAAGGPCPFLMDNSCSIHPMRPVACRQFNVFGSPCGEGEDPYFTRRGDVLTPIEGYTHRAFSVMLPFYGVDNKGDVVRSVKSVIHTLAVNLQSYDWKKLITIMNEFDLRK